MISDDGRFVAFESSASNLVSGDTNGVADVFVRDLANGTTQRSSTGRLLDQGTGASTRPDLSGDGRYVAFDSTAYKFDPDRPDNNGTSDVFLRRVNRADGLVRVSELVRPRGRPTRAL